MQKIRFLIALLLLAALMISPALAHTDLMRGSKGDDVLALQQRLNALGYSVGTADGDFGGKTENALLKFQADNGLEQTGIYDAATHELLYSPENNAIVREQELANIAPDDIWTVDENGLITRTIYDVIDGMPYIWTVSGTREDGQEFVECGMFVGQATKSGTNDYSYPLISSKAGVYGPYRFTISNANDISAYDMYVRVEQDLPHLDDQHQLNRDGTPLPVHDPNGKLTLIPSSSMWGYHEPLEHFRTDSEKIPYEFTVDPNGYLEFTLINTKPNTLYQASLSGTDTNGNPIDWRDTFLGGDVHVIGWNISDRLGIYGPYHLSVSGGGETLEFDFNVMVPRNFSYLKDKCLTGGGQNWPNYQFVMLPSEIPTLLIETPVEDSRIHMWEGRQDFFVKAILSGVYEGGPFPVSAVLYNADTGKHIATGEPCYSVEYYLTDDLKLHPNGTGITPMYFDFDFPPGYNKGTRYKAVVTIGDLSVSTTFSFMCDGDPLTLTITDPIEGGTYLGAPGFVLQHHYAVTNDAPGREFRLIKADTGEVIYEESHYPSPGCTDSLAGTSCEWNDGFFIDADFESGEYILIRREGDIEDSIRFILINANRPQ